MSNVDKNILTAKDFASDQDIRWCPGCGDYSILKQVQSILPETGINKEDIVFISGIGCSSRFPYYMNTYGMHSVHGRAPSVATGLKIANPDLSIWVITGDGDALSIGGNHLIHVLRRNVNLNILLFNNEIYGLTKGQYSPTSPIGTTTKSSPMGSIDAPFNPLALCLGAGGTFIARSMDRDVKHLRKQLLNTNQHNGTSILEIYQNCNVFNDGAFFTFTEKDSKPKSVLFAEPGEPLKFGQEMEFGIKLDGFKPVIVDTKSISDDELWIHDPKDKTKAHILTQMFDDPRSSELPRPFGILYEEDRAIYEDGLINQLKEAVDKKGEPDLDALLKGNFTWVID